MEIKSRIEMLKIPIQIDQKDIKKYANKLIRLKSILIFNMKF